jgi:oxygen-independent coproporphyrinogen-3 oxidase
VTPDLLRLLKKYDHPLPRYTSYPPANHFHAGAGAGEYRAVLGDLAPADPLAVYVHVPFCEHRCAYCGCHVIPTARRSIGSTYTDYLIREMDLVAARLAGRGRLAAIHLGGGTPTYLEPRDLERLLAALRERFPPAEKTEVAVEVDPRVTTPEHLESLARSGVNRLSLGVQDTCPEVQAAIGRHQTREVTLGFFDRCQQRGFRHLNVDLVYGLPLQTRERFQGTLKDVVSLRPERVAVFAYAHVPWARPNQAAIDEAALPSASERLALLLEALAALEDAGYVHIGLDHFALPDDDLARAHAAGRLGRTFMGYTPRNDLKTIGLGVSAISDLGTGYFQNAKKLSTYFQGIDRGEFPVEKGFLCSPRDACRRWVLQQVFCRLRVDYQDFARRFGADFKEHFREEVAALRGLEADGLAEVGMEALTVPPPGRLFLRNIGAVFDEYLGRNAEDAFPYSRAV